jgi:DNA mismatch repair ATPase MutS
MEKRLDAIQELNQDSISRDEIREYLNPVYDLERLLSKVTYKTANPRDLIAFRNSLQMLPPIKTVLSGFQKEELAAIREEIDGLEDIYQLIDEAIKKDAVLILLLGLHIFLHHWCQFSHDFLLFCKRIHDKADTQKLAYPHLS